MNGRGKGGVDVRMLELLVCPLSHGPLEFDAEHNELVSPRARMAFPVRDGVPILLASEARPLPEE